MSLGVGTVLFFVPQRRTVSSGLRVSQRTADLPGLQGMCHSVCVPELGGDELWQLAVWALGRGLPCLPSGCSSHVDALVSIQDDSCPPPLHFINQGGWV